MSISEHQTASGRPLRIAPAWVGAAGSSTEDDPNVPVRGAVWIFSVRRYARVALWTLPASALLLGWSTLPVATPPGPLAVRLAAGWLSTVAMIALAGLLAGTRGRRPAVLGLIVGIAGSIMLLLAVNLWRDGELR